MAPSEIDGVMGDNWYRFFENNFGPFGVGFKHDAAD
jgi:hypothetical protein